MGTGKQGRTPSAGMGDDRKGECAGKGWCAGARTGAAGSRGRPGVQRGTRGRLCASPFPARPLFPLATQAGEGCGIAAELRRQVAAHQTFANSGGAKPCQKKTAHRSAMGRSAQVHHCVRLAPARPPLWRAERAYNMRSRNMRRGRTLLCGRCSRGRCYADRLVA